MIQHSFPTRRSSDLRGSSRVSFPPSRRDAVILGGTIFDLLENERGPEACERLVSSLQIVQADVARRYLLTSHHRPIHPGWDQRAA